MVVQVDQVDQTPCRYQVCNSPAVQPSSTTFVSNTRHTARHVLSIQAVRVAAQAEACLEEGGGASTRGLALEALGAFCKGLAPGMAHLEERWGALLRLRRKRLGC